MPFRLYKKTEFESN